MNKRFSTLVAAALVAGGLSTMAMAQSAPARFQSEIPAVEVTVDDANESYYYHLGDNDKYLTFKTKATDKKVYLVVNEVHESSADPDVYVNSMDSVLWLPTITISNGARSFQFTNKLTDEVLAIKYAGTDKEDKAEVELVSEDTEGAFSSFVLEDDKLISYDANKQKYVLNFDATNNKVTFCQYDAAKSTSYGEVKLFTPAQKLMSAKELNALGNGSFKLNVQDPVTDNSADFINAKSFIAYQSVGNATGGVYLQVKDERMEGTQVASDGETTLDNKHVFLVVDTVFNKAMGTKLDSIGGRGLRIYADTITCMWDGNGASVDATKSDLYDAGEYLLSDYKLSANGFYLDSIGRGAKLETAAGRVPANYRFYIYRDVAKVGAESFTVKVDSIPTIFVEEEGSYFSNRSEAYSYSAAKTDSVGYFAIARIGSATPGIFTVIDSTTLSTATSDVLATIATTDGEFATFEKGIYSIQVKDGKYKAAALRPATSGNERAVDPEFESVDAASVTLPSTQFAIEGRNGSYKVSNRENNVNPFNNTTAKVYIYKTATADEYTVSADEDNTYIIKKMDVDVDDVYMGYKNFTKDELANFTARLKFNVSFGSDNLYVVADKDGNLSVQEVDAAAATEFQFAAAPTDSIKSGDDKGKLSYEAKAFGNGDLKRNAYYLHMPGERNDIFYYNPDTKAFGIQTLTEAEKRDSVAVPVMFRATAIDKQYEIILPDTVCKPTSEGSKGIPAQLAYFRMDSLYKGRVNVAGTNSSLVVTEFTSAPAGYFTLELPDDAAFVDPIEGTPSHNRIASARNTTLALSMNDSKQAVLNAETELKDDAYVESDFSLYVDTACMDNQKGEKPLFYILTTRGLDAEAVADGQAMYMSSKDGSSLEFIKAKQFGEAGRDSLLVYATKATEKDAKLKLADNYATFAFASTSTKGEYKIQNVKSGKYLAYINGALTLADKSPYSGLAFTVNAVEAPTSNEGVAVSEVTVIAQNGAVRIANAAGKKVVITNILGQTVANTVITSSDATIAAPQGVVVVAVEGEEAVKAIVK